MDRLRKVIEEHGRWAALSVYTERIEAHATKDFSHAVENAKALLETIGKEICVSKGEPADPKAKFHAVMKRAFAVIGYPASDMVTQISGALATIGQQVGNLRNEISPTSHGKSLDELKARNDRTDILTREFLIDTTVIVACFMIRAFESASSQPKSELPEAKLVYADDDPFNIYWDELYGEFEMGDYAYPASEILYHVDYEAYMLSKGDYDLFLKDDDELIETMRKANEAAAKWREENWYPKRQE